MWVAKIKIWHKNSYTAEKTKDMDAWFASYNLNSFEKEGKTWLSRAMIIHGPDTEKVIAAMKTDPRLTIEEVRGKQVLFSMPAVNQFHSLQFDHTVFMLKPNISRNGIEYWTVGSIDKKHINGLIKRVNKLKPNAWAQLLKLSDEDVDLFIPSIFSKLTEKQVWAYETACRLGYYAFPRKMDLEQIAKKIGVPASTFREHLRIAESKLLPALGNSMSPE